MENSGGYIHLGWWRNQLGLCILCACEHVPGSVCRAVKHVDSIAGKVKYSRPKLN